MARISKSTIITILSLALCFLFLYRSQVPCKETQNLVQFTGEIPRKPIFIQENPSKSTFTQEDPSKPIVVLAWTTYNGNPWTGIDDLFDKCSPDLNCVITHDYRRLNESSAVLFYIRSIRWTHLPPNRSTNKYYVFTLAEAPFQTDTNLFKNGRSGFFNLTMTHRRDSDIYWPYGDFIPITDGQKKSFARYQKNLTKIVKRKSKMVAWFVSHCATPSEREKTVEKLGKYVKVDIYGYCGNLSCPLVKGGREPGLDDASPCHRMLTKEYKFYLSFENALCRDYVTEKFYKIMDNALIVPIVLERKIVLETIIDPQIAHVINRSFIAVDDFPNLKALSKYLKYLSRNSTEYMEYFKWRRKYQVILDDSAQGSGCQLCRILKEGQKKRIRNITDWWYRDSKCHNPDGSRFIY